MFYGRFAIMRTERVASVKIRNELVGFIDEHGSITYNTQRNTNGNRALGPFKAVVIVEEIVNRA